jgi:hypothetical protein
VKLEKINSHTACTFGISSFAAPCTLQPFPAWRPLAENRSMVTVVNDAELGGKRGDGLLRRVIEDDTACGNPATPVKSENGGRWSWLFRHGVVYHIETLNRLKLDQYRHQSRDRTTVTITHEKRVTRDAATHPSEPSGQT